MSSSRKSKQPKKKPAAYACNRSAVRGLRAREVDLDIPSWSSESSRRASCRDSLAAFIREYLPSRFPVAMSSDHITALDRMQDAILHGNQYAQAAPRGDGKTERSIAAVLWATLYGHRRFVPVIAADLNSAKSIVAEVFAELADNDALMEDWPQVCLPFREVQARPNRARFLTHKGEPVKMDAKTSRLVFASPKVSAPSAPDPACGAVIVARGLTSSLRGLRHSTTDGKTMRPDLAVIDDPQTDESANSPEQCKTRESLIAGAILGLAGPNRKIAAIANMTIIKIGDLAHRLLDPALHPEWNGIRFAMVYEWPKAKDTLWKQYAEIRREGMRDGTGIDAATQFYADHRAEMDEGAIVGWEHRKREGELSALQCAMNILIDHGEDVFFAEYQNDPRQPESIGWEITPEIVAGHLSHTPRGVIPDNCEVLTVGADVNLYGINWVMDAWTMDGAGYRVDWGKFPGGDGVIWDARTSTVSEEQAIFLAIHGWAADLATRPYVKAATAEVLKPNIIAVDCGYKRDAVFKGVSAIRQTFGGSTVMPIRGISSRHYRPRAGDRKGDGWHVSQLGAAKATIINADIWRERSQKAFILPVGCPGGSVALYGSDQSKHRTLADHICAEKVVDILTGEKLGAVYVWSLLPGRKNDLGDASTYSLAAAGYGGVTFGAEKKSRSQSQQPAHRMAPANPVSNIPTAKPSSTTAIHRKPFQRPRRGGFVSSW